MAKILVVDDEDKLRPGLVKAAKAVSASNTIIEAGSRTGSVDEAIQLIQANDFDVIVLDARLQSDMEEYTGLDVLKAAKQKDIYTQVLVVTGYGTAALGAEAMRLGAFDYLERNAPGIDFKDMLRQKIALALEFRKAKLAGIGKHE